MFKSYGRRLASVAVAVGLMIPAGAALAQDGAGAISDDELDRIAPPIPVAQAESVAPADPAVAAQVENEANRLEQYITTDEDGSPELDADRALADGVDPALVQAAEAIEDKVEDKLDEADLADGKDDGQVPVEAVAYVQQPSTPAQNELSSNAQQASLAQSNACKPKERASSSRRIELNPVINGIKYKGHKQITNYVREISAMCAFYSWSIKEERQEIVWVLNGIIS